MGKLTATWLIGLLLLVVVVVAGCRASIPTDESAAIARVWPEPPAEPRVVFQRAFSAPGELGIRVGLLGRLAGFFAGESPMKMVKPMAVVVTPEEVYYVADPGRGGVHRYDVRKGRYALILGEDNSPLPSPVGLALASDGRVYVADSYLGKIMVIAPESATAIALTLSDPPKQPTGIAVDPESGNLYVVDTASHQVDVYSAAGQLLRRFGKRGQAMGELNYPTMIWMSDQRQLLVTDSMNFRVNVYDLAGAFLYSFGHPGDGSGDLSRPKGVATDSFGHIYLIDGLFHLFQIFDNGGNLLLTVGSNGRAAGEFFLPTGIFITEDNTIFICDSQNQRVQIFRYIGV